jgi:hypothetical protein
MRKRTGSSLQERGRSLRRLLVQRTFSKQSEDEYDNAAFRQRTAARVAEARVGPERDVLRTEMRA